MIPLILSSVQGFAQIGSYFSIGETVLFEVNPGLGVSYCWKVTEKLTSDKSAETDKVTYLTTQCNPAIRLKWEKSGTYFLSVTGFNQNGCSNRKVFQVIVAGNHIPVANDDYVTTNWLKSIRIDLLANDQDAGNDLDSSTLKILTKTEYGEITVGTNGAITYQPIRNQTGNERFYYRICDSVNQCDSAMVSVNLTDPPLYLPEGLSPNGDGVNDRFVIGGLDAYPKSSLTIFRRDGVIIYRSDNYQNDWRVEVNSHPIPSGTYYYLFHPGGTNRVIKGFIYITK
jgi:gliding motility-associated-like protein